MKQWLTGQTNGKIVLLFYLIQAGMPGVVAQFGINFTDVTAQSNITSTEASYGCAWGDVNGDGLPDVFVSHHYGLINPQLPVIYLNLGNGIFSSSVYTLQLNGNRDLHGAAWADFDNDGDDDLILLTGGNSANLFYVNDESTVFTDSAQAYNPHMPTARGRTPAWLDADNDGKLDLIVCNEKRPDNLYPSTLFRQDNATFININSSASFSYGTSLSFVSLSDLNGTGLPEAFIVYRTTQYIRTLGSFPLGSVSFPMTHQVSDAICADFNNDLLPDILMVRQKNASGVFNDSPGRLSAILMPPDSAEHGFSFSAADSVHFSPELNPYQQYNIRIGGSGYVPTTSSFYLHSADTINHGIYPHITGMDEGIYIGFNPVNNSWSISYCVLNNNKIGVRIQSPTVSQPVPIGFTPASPSLPAYYVQTATGFINAGLAAGFTDSLHAATVVAGDFDNDMDLDVLIGCNNGVINLPEVLYENNGSGIFTKVPGTAGAISSSYGRTESVTTADFDLDGFLDLLMTNGAGEFLLENAPYQLFRNSGNANNWLAIDLQGTTSNRNGIGAKVYVTAGGITQMREQNNGMHFASQNFRRIHFGLGPNYLVSLLEVHWPDGTIQQFQNIAANQILTVNQSTGLGISLAGILSDRLTVFPNPANDRIFIRYPSHAVLNSDLTLRIFHSTGRLVYSQPCFYPDYPVSICIKQLVPGAYYLNILSSTDVYNVPFVKVR